MYEIPLSSSWGCPIPAVSMQWANESLSTTTRMQLDFSSSWTWFPTNDPTTTTDTLFTSHTPLGHKISGTVMHPSQVSLMEAPFLPVTDPSVGQVTHDTLSTLHEEDFLISLWNDNDNDDDECNITTNQGMLGLGSLEDAGSTTSSSSSVLHQWRYQHDITTLVWKHHHDDNDDAVLQLFTSEDTLENEHYCWYNSQGPGWVMALEEVLGRGIVSRPQQQEGEDPAHIWQKPLQTIQLNPILPFHQAPQSIVMEYAREYNLNCGRWNPRTQTIVPQACTQNDDWTLVYGTCQEDHTTTAFQWSTPSDHHDRSYALTIPQRPVPGSSLPSSMCWYGLVPTFKEQWVLGYPFFQTHSVAFDLEWNRIGLSQEDASSSVLEETCRPRRDARPPSSQTHPHKPQEPLVPPQLELDSTPMSAPPVVHHDIYWTCQAHPAMPTQQVLHEYPRTNYVESPMVIHKQTNDTVTISLQQMWFTNEMDVISIQQVVHENNDQAQCWEELSVARTTSPVTLSCPPNDNDEYRTVTLDVYCVNEEYWGSMPSVDVPSTCPHAAASQTGVVLFTFVVPCAPHDPAYCISNETSTVDLDDKQDNENLSSNDVAEEAEQDTSTPNSPPSEITEEPTGPGLPSVVLAIVISMFVVACGLAYCFHQQQKRRRQRKQRYLIPSRSRRDGSLEQSIRDGLQFGFVAETDHTETSEHIGVDDEDHLFVMGSQQAATRPHSILA